MLVGLRILILQTEGSRIGTTYVSMTGCQRTSCYRDVEFNIISFNTYLKKEKLLINRLVAIGTVLIFYNSQRQNVSDVANNRLTKEQNRI